jgi:hypothetical protein
MIGGRGLIGRNGLCTLIECEPVRPPFLAVRGVLLFMAAALLLGTVGASWVTPERPPAIGEIQ